MQWLDVNGKYKAHHESSRLSVPPRNEVRIEVFASARIAHECEPEATDRIHLELFLSHDVLKLGGGETLLTNQNINYNSHVL